MDLDLIEALDLTNNGRKKLILLGKTGSGKSALCNALCQSIHTAVFPESPSQVMGNTNTILTNICFRGETGKRISLIDTVGFDSSVMSNSKVAELIVKLKDGCDFINLFGVVVSAPKRLEESLRRTIELFENMFGKRMFWKNAVLIFTNLDQSVEQIAKRAKFQSDKKMTVTFREELRRQFKFNDDLPALILDAHYNEKSKQERRMFKDSANQLYDLLMHPGRKACTVQNIQKVMEHDEELMQMVKRYEKKFQKEKNRAEELQTFKDGGITGAIVVATTAAVGLVLAGPAIAANVAAAAAAAAAAAGGITTETVIAGVTTLVAAVVSGAARGGR